MNKKSIIAIVVGLMILAPVIWGFVASQKTRETEDQRDALLKAPSRVAQVRDQTTVTLSVADQQQSGIVVVAQRPSSHRPLLQTFGTVLDVTELIALRGATVAAQAQIDKADAAVSASRAEYQRLQLLHRGERDISDRALQTAGAVWQVDQASMRVAQAALTTAQLSAVQRWGRVLAKAAADNEALFKRLVSRQQVLIQVLLPAATALAQAPPQAQLLATDGALRTAMLISPALQTDPRLQGASYFYASASEGLLPGMTITAYLPTAAPLQGTTIPASAVVWWQGRAWIYSRDRTDRFVRIALPVDNPVDGGWFVPKGFAQGDPVVATGAQLLLSEEQRARLSSGGDGDDQ